MQQVQDDPVELSGLLHIHNMSHIRNEHALCGADAHFQTLRCYQDSMLIARPDED
jgi:hypothetical protein